MTEQYPTLRTILDVSERAVAQAIAAAIDESVWDTVQIPRRLRAGAAGKIAKTLDAFLSTSVLGLVTVALADYPGLAKFADGRDHVLDKLALSIESEHAPHVDLRVSGLPPLPVAFPVTVSLQFTSTTLVISGDRVMTMRPGPCIAAGTLYCEEVEVFNRPASPFTLRHEMLFGTGIPIRVSSQRG
ncbi:MAG: hypothetical protein ABIT20_24000 [Gemmatimonadaceae bacterium]